MLEEDRDYHARHGVPIEGCCNGEGCWGCGKCDGEGCEPLGDDILAPYTAPGAAEIAGGDQHWDWPATKSLSLCRDHSHGDRWWLSWKWGQVEVTEAQAREIIRQARGEWKKAREG